MTAVATFTLTGDLGTLVVGGNVQRRLLRARLESNTNGLPIVDTNTNGQLHFGSIPLKLAVDGKFTQAGIISSNATGTNIVEGTLQYQVVVDYDDPNTGRSLPAWESGWFAMTADADLRDKADSAIEVPIEWRSIFQADMEELKDETEAARDAASDSADAAAASQSAAAGSASSASTSAGTATTKAAEALASKNAADTAKANAETAETHAETAQGLAEDARDVAVTAKNEAESARDDVVAVVATTDGLMTTVDADDSSDFRVQQDARLTASYAAFTDEVGDPIPDKRARIIFDSTGFPVDIILEDA